LIFFFAAIYEGKGSTKGYFGLASLNLNEPLIRMCQFFDIPNTFTKLTCKINSIDPTEVVIAYRARQKWNAVENALDKMFKDNFSNIKVNQLQGKHFNESNGIDFIKKYSNNVSIDLQSQ
jgi:hypothetical protein